MVDDYICTFPDKIQVILSNIRDIVQQASPPEVQETIRYKMPAYKVHNKDLIYFAAFQNHIGVYPPVSPNSEDEEHEVLIQDIAKYTGPKGNLKFPLNMPIPYDLIERVVKHRIKSTNRRHLAGVKKVKATVKKREVKGKISKGKGKNKSLQRLEKEYKSK